MTEPLKLSDIYGNVAGWEGNVATNLERYRLKTGENPPVFEAGEWNVLNISTAELMLGCSVTEAQADWWCTYYNTMYPQFAFDACRRVK